MDGQRFCPVHRTSERGPNSVPRRTAVDDPAWWFKKAATSIRVYRDFQFGSLVMTDERLYCADLAIREATVALSLSHDPVNDNDLIASHYFVPQPVFIELETLGRQRLGRVLSTLGPDADAMMEGHAVSGQVDLEAAAVTKASTRARRSTVSTAFKASVSKRFANHFFTPAPERLSTCSVKRIASNAFADGRNDNIVGNGFAYMAVLAVSTSDVAG
jgi:hypothetical protein